MGLCSGDACRWYGEAKPGYRKCFYGEPACLRGWVDQFAAIIKYGIKLRFSRHKKNEKEE